MQCMTFFFFDSLADLSREHYQNWENTRRAMSIGGSNRRNWWMSKFRVIFVLSREKPMRFYNRGRVTQGSVSCGHFYAICWTFWEYNELLLPVVGEVCLMEEVSGQNVLQCSTVESNPLLIDEEFLSSWDNRNKVRGQFLVLAQVSMCMCFLGEFQVCLPLLSLLLQIPPPSRSNTRNYMTPVRPAIFTRRMSTVSWIRPLGDFRTH